MPALDKPLIREKLADLSLYLDELEPLTTCELKEYQEDTDPNVPNAEAFPLWIVAVVVMVVIAAAISAAFLWIRRK